MIKAYLALGSNLQNPISQVTTALKELSEMADIALKRCSGLYRNPPVGLTDQPDFINAVAEIETSLSAHDLLQIFFEIEKKHLRVRREMNGPRTLDLDLLLFGNQVIDQPHLQVPHPRLKERSFVVLPLAEIAPFLILPCGTAIKDLVKVFDSSDLQIAVRQEEIGVC
jgi:2-amino-4-hydroxy-6-hydroxymethyldihydropteridine diphosphokinase